ncbi:MAG: phenylalanine--tRNA ligase subunit alpha [Eubacteriaceae bacterium]|jgi:phenylalanyl-tRNA synthetase alpha chain
MKEELLAIKSDFQSELGKAESLKDLEDLRVRFLGKKGSMTAVMKGMGKLSKEERPVMGALANEVRETITGGIADRKEQIENARLQEQLESEKLDVTLPGTELPRGGKHPLQIVIDELEDIFLGMGFSIVDGPEIEWSKFNFDYLNMPPEHSSRDLSESFYVDTTDGSEIVLRTQTSPVQVRTMLKKKPPLKIISPGRVYRADEIDATHSPVFHQIEGLVIDKNITMSDLKGTLSLFAKKLYGEDVQTRFRPHQFYFTEPSAEMDVTCAQCGGKGCRVCGNTGWIEVLGCGMVHPNVLRQCGIDPEVYSGFAFGAGLDRIATLKYGIPDLRLLFENDLRFLTQFK